jgi:hypothetical protein
MRNTVLRTSAIPSARALAYRSTVSDNIAHVRHDAASLESIEQGACQRTGPGRQALCEYPVYAASSQKTYVPTGSYTMVLEAVVGSHTICWSGTTHCLPCRTFVFD